MSLTWLGKENFLETVIDRLEPADSVLDIGCGIMPQQYIRPVVHICCEPYSEYLEFLRRKVSSEEDRIYVIMKGSWADAVRIFPPKSVDSVFLVDVIEHVEKQEAVMLLKETEKVARRQIAIFTPLGYVEQKHRGGKDAWGLGGVAWQEHKSGWNPEDFDSSWNVYACEKFHEADNLGGKRENPLGALWALKTFSENELESGVKLRRKRNIYNMISLAMDVNRDYVIKLIIRFLNAVLKVKKSKIVNRVYLKFASK